MGIENENLFLKYFPKFDLNILNREIIIYNMTFIITTNKCE